MFYFLHKTVLLTFPLTFYANLVFNENLRQLSSRGTAEQVGARPVGTEHVRRVGVRRARPYASHPVQTNNMIVCTRLWPVEYEGRSMYRNTINVVQSDATPTYSAIIIIS